MYECESDVTLAIEHGDLEQGSYHSKFTYYGFGLMRRRKLLFLLDVVSKILSIYLNTLIIMRCEILLSEMKTHGRQDFDRRICEVELTSVVSCFKSFLLY